MKVNHSFRVSTCTHVSMIDKMHRNCRLIAITIITILIKGNHLIYILFPHVIISRSAEPQDECLSCGKLYLVVVAAAAATSDNSNHSPPAALVPSKGFCKKCDHHSNNNNNNRTETGSLSDKESSYSIKRSFNGSEEELDGEEEEEDEMEEDAYLEVID